MEFVISVCEVSDTELLPLMEPDRPSVPAVAVSSTVLAEMVPAAELVRLFPATRLKSVPAAEAAETLTEPLALMLTGPAALALRFAALVARGALGSPILPAVEVRLSVGVVMVP